MDLPDPRIKPESPTLAGRSFTPEPPGKPRLPYPTLKTNRMVKPRSQIPSEVDRRPTSKPLSLCPSISSGTSLHPPPPSPRCIQYTPKAQGTHTYMHTRASQFSLSNVPKTESTFLSPTGALLFLPGLLSVPTPHSAPITL